MGRTMRLPGVTGRANCPRETDEAKALVRWMDAKRLFYTPILNGGYRLGGNRFATAARLKAEGLRPGMPDYLILTPPPGRPGAPGAAIELKRRIGGTVSEYQRQRLGELASLGWVVTVARGADEAIEWLRHLGY